jgi:hypothetical protein
MTFGTTDNIEEFVGAEKVEDDPVYSLSGVKLAPSLNGASLPAGVYIHKGKKIVVK